MARRALISGASIAGPTLAYWLHRYGWETTVVERAPELRLGGQNVDVRGAGREVARRMGVEDDIRAATTGEVGTRFVGRNGVTSAEFPAGTSDSGGATAELEILRGDLAALLVQRTAGDTEYRYGDRVTAVHDDAADGIAVSFEHGQEERFDLVVAADGLRSSTRDLVFGDEAEIRPLGLETSWATIPRTATDDDWWRWYSAPGGRSVTLRPDPHGTIRAALSVVTPRDRATTQRRRSPDEQRAHLRDVFTGAGWETERVLDAIDLADDLYFESIAQVRAPRWSSGRVALLGDAAYCASPVSGMGTSLSLAGAYVLAGEIAAHVDLRDAFGGYERVMRPWVERAQQLPPGTPRLANPVTRAGVTAFGLAVRVGASPVAGRIAGHLFTPPAEAIDLPDYRHLER
ncbi:FAD-dependent monooxygenase [Curtobacterium sp. MCLR17_007]|uniref:FAD-dependent monooxygenase n=1 Tax=Curtobacterium sp. MCLR17_007 TaxID=2175648 RepID=UPI000DA8F1A7|nr:FAD-dependent monooxygenase [Curtobacterium sp. MCLR17_007]WIB60171.1 FAD-dependent monooxygenase [Curtobacterium sp. MCLR17_007]